MIDHNDFESTTSTRRVGHEGVDELLWVTEDVGAFGNEHDGPLFDWIDGKDSFMRHVKEFGTVVQAGGACGMYPRFYSNYFKNVYTFEPDVQSFYCLDRNCVGDQYHKYNAALGCNLSKCSVNRITPFNIGMNTVAVSADGAIDVITIDSLNLPQCDLLHLDVEGFEPQALLGAINTIQRFSPVIIIEHERGGEIIEPLGYRMIERLRMDSVYIRD